MRRIGAFSTPRHRKKTGFAATGTRSLYHHGIAPGHRDRSQPATRGAVAFGRIGGGGAGFGSACGSNLARIERHGHKFGNRKYRVPSIVSFSTPPQRGLFVGESAGRVQSDDFSIRTVLIRFPALHNLVHRMPTRIGASGDIWQITSCGDAVARRATKMAGVRGTDRSPA